MLPSRGRPGTVLLMEVERELTSADILRLATDPSLGRIGPPTVQRFKDRHHRIAILLASGKSVVEVAQATGVTPQRVGDLERTDPAFQELLTHYRGQIADLSLDEAVEFHGKLTDISRGALEEIQLRVETDDLRAKMSIEELRRLAEMGLDRTTNPPRTAQPATQAPTRITFNMGPRKIESKIIDQDGSEIEFTETKGD